MIFSSYENTVNYLERHPYFKSKESYRKNNNSSYFNVSIGGLVAGCFSTFISTPQECIKQTAQMNIKNIG